MAQETKSTIAQVKETAGMFALNVRDLALSAIVAGAAAAIDMILSIINAYLIEKIPLVFDWKEIGNVALAGALAYLTKNFFTPQKTIVLAPSEEVKIIDKGTGTTLKPDNESLKSRHETIKPPQS
jgi:hypothetical protein